MFRRRVDPQDVGLDLIFLDDFGSLCGMPHPKLDGNYCELPEGHKPETHLDGAGNEWIGRITE